LSKHHESSLLLAQLQLMNVLKQIKSLEQESNDCINLRTLKIAKAGSCTSKLEHKMPGILEKMFDLCMACDKS